MIICSQLGDVSCRSLVKQCILYSVYRYIPSTKDEAGGVYARCVPVPIFPKGGYSKAIKTIQVCASIMICEIYMEGVDNVQTCHSPWCTLCILHLGLSKNVE